MLLLMYILVNMSDVIIYLYLYFIYQCVFEFYNKEMTVLLECDFIYFIPLIFSLSLK